MSSLFDKLIAVRLEAGRKMMAAICFEHLETNCKKCKAAFGNYSEKVLKDPAYLHRKYIKKFEATYTKEEIKRMEKQFELLDPE